MQLASDISGKCRVVTEEISPGEWATKVGYLSQKQDEFVVDRVAKNMVEAEKNHNKALKYYETIN